MMEHLEDEDLCDKLSSVNLSEIDTADALQEMVSTKGALLNRRCHRDHMDFTWRAM